MDLKARQLSTTAASTENRQTIAEFAGVSEGLVRLQGYEGRRAFSLLISEASGQGTFVSAGEGRALSAFTACTPLED